MNESLYANERKLKKLLTLALGKDVEEFSVKQIKDYEANLVWNKN